MLLQNQGLFEQIYAVLMKHLACMSRNCARSAKLAALNEQNYALHMLIDWILNAMVALMNSYK